MQILQNILQPIIVDLLVYGVGGLILPFAGIKLIDAAISALHLV